MRQKHSRAEAKLIAPVGKPAHPQHPLTMGNLPITPALAPDAPSPHKRRPRYSGKHPRRFAEKYKEHRRDAETVERVLASGKTPAGTHRPIMVQEILAALNPKSGEVAVDCTLGFGGHAEAILPLLEPSGRLIALDADPIELPRTEARLRALGFGPDRLTVRRSNFAGLPQVLASESLGGVDMILADLGVSSMQLDDPARGFTFKDDGPLDMRMNPRREPSAAQFIARSDARRLARCFAENADEPHAEVLAESLAGRSIATTRELRDAIVATLKQCPAAERDLSVRRVFQALRVAVNDEFAALDALLRNAPGCLNAGGRIALLTFHSGEDRRVKKAFQAALREGVYDEASEALGPSAVERAQNPRSASAKLRWARRVKG